MNAHGRLLLEPVVRWVARERVDIKTRVVESLVAISLLLAQQVSPEQTQEQTTGSESLGRQGPTQAP